MSTEIPPLPRAHPLSRLVRLARIDGWSVLILALVCGLWALPAKDWPTAIGALAALAASSMELKGARQCHAGNRQGITWLLRAQVLLLGTILAYCAWRLWHPDYAHLEALLSAKTRKTLQETGVNLQDLLHLAYPLTYTILAIASLLAQGLMILHYARSAKHFPESRPDSA